MCGYLILTAVQMCSRPPSQLSPRSTNAMRQHCESKLIGHARLYWVTQVPCQPPIDNVFDSFTTQHKPVQGDSRRMGGTLSLDVADRRNTGSSKHVHMVRDRYKEQKSFESPTSSQNVLLLSGSCLTDQASPPA